MTAKFVHTYVICHVSKKDALWEVCEQGVVERFHPESIPALLGSNKKDFHVQKVHHSILQPIYSIYSGTCIIWHPFGNKKHAVLDSQLGYWIEVPCRLGRFHCTGTASLYIHKTKKPMGLLCL